MSPSKNNRHIDDALADQGWSQMKIVLDKEMPKKRDRKLIWWITGGITFMTILIAAFVGFGLMNDQDIVSKNTVSQEKNLLDKTNLPKNSVSDQELSKTRDEVLGNANQEIINPAGQSVKSNSKSSAPEILSSIDIEPERTVPTDIKDSEITTKNGNDHQQDLFPGADVSMIIAEEKVKNLLETDQPVRQEELYLSATESPKKQNLSGEREAGLDKVLPLDPIVSAFITAVKAKSDEKLAIALVPNHKPKMELGLTSALSFEKSKFASIGAGTYMRYHLNSRWSIYSGLRLTFKSNSEYLLSNLDSTEAIRSSSNSDNLDNMGQTPGTGVSQSTDQNESISQFKSFVSNNNFLSISMPIKVIYRLNSNWDVNAGVTANFLIDNYSSSANQDLSNLQGAFSGNTSLYLNRWQGTFDLGFGYQLNRSFRIHANYQSPWKLFDLDHLEQGPLFGKGLKLGIDYKLR